MIRASAFGCAFVLLVAGTQLSAQELNEKTYASRRTFLLPKPDELRWEKIAWRPKLWDAVIEAHRVKKPILLWTMNGHPLACT
ncbi:MAG: hypothetical protein HYZ53_15885 [Planctomycetes bacterium]|nr:hypothetical protein [Planctomycetota bacterium]